MLTTEDKIAITNKKRNLEGLHKEEMQSQIKKGVGILMSLAGQMLATSGRATPSLTLPPPVHPSPSPSEDEAPNGEDI